MRMYGGHANLFGHNLTPSLTKTLEVVQSMTGFGWDVNYCDGNGWWQISRTWQLHQIGFLGPSLLGCIKKLYEN